MTNLKSFSFFRNVFFAFTAVFLLASCQDEEMLETPQVVESATDATPVESNVSSLTITGANTEFVENVNCTSCTYVVDKNTETIDGEALGLKPGSVICLDAAVKYGNLTFINLEGTEENPIVIGNCKK